MATLQIEFKNRKFVSNNGVDVSVMTDTHVEGNGWFGDVDEKGNITFTASRNYNRERHLLKFTINNGYVKRILKIGNNMPKTVKSFRISGWPVDGVIGLSSGYVDNRTAYFRTAQFHQFLNENGLTAVRCAEANGIHTLVKKYKDESIFLLESIETDGEITELGEYDNKLLQTKEQMIEVTGATWVIKTIWKHGKLNNRILYTPDNPREIVGLPKFKLE